MVLLIIIATERLLRYWMASIVLYSDVHACMVAGFMGIYTSPKYKQLAIASCINEGAKKWAQHFTPAKAARKMNKQLKLPISYVIAD